MTKTSKKARATVQVGSKAVKVKATPVRRKKVAEAVVEAPVAETLVEASVAKIPAAEVAPVAEVAEAPKAGAVFTIPDLGVSDLVVSREGYKQLPGKTWHRLSNILGKDSTRKAIDIMVKLELRLPLAMELATWPAFRPHMVGQLAAVQANQDVLNVLEWVWKAGEGWTWREAYEVFPRAGTPGGKATKKEIGKFNKLVSLLDALRKEGKTSIRNVDLLAQAANLIGWIK